MQQEIKFIVIAEVFCIRSFLSQKLSNSQIKENKQNKGKQSNYAIN